MTSLVVRRTDVSDLGFGACPARLDVPLLDDYLIFLAGRSRLNTVLATEAEPGMPSPPPALTQVTPLRARRRR